MRLSASGEVEDFLLEKSWLFDIPCCQFACGG
jgi:hypothetical protein